MKKVFHVYEDYAPGSGDPLGRHLKKFKHESEAVAFTENEKNIQQYNGLSLYCIDGDGVVMRYCGSGMWEAMS